MCETIEIFLGKVCCFFGYHKVKKITKRRGIAGGCHCIREGCNWRIEPVVWLRRPKEKGLPKKLEDELNK